MGGVCRRMRLMAQASAISLDRMVRAVEKVRERLLLATEALERAGVDYAVVGGNAVAAWVSSVDEGAVRNTRDVDIMVNRAELDRVRAALEDAGFVYRHVAGVDVFLDHARAGALDGVHVVFAGEMVRKDEAAPNPALTEATSGPGFRLLGLKALVQVKLTAFRRKDQVHLQDMIRVGLIDDSWLARFEPPLRDRLEELLNDPEG